jgi:hypothetical protein
MLKYLRFFCIFIVMENRQMKSVDDIETGGQKKAKTLMGVS